MPMPLTRKQYKERYKKRFIARFGREAWLKKQADYARDFRRWHKENPNQSRKKIKTFSRKEIDRRWKEKIIREYGLEELKRRQKRIRLRYINNKLKRLGLSRVQDLFEAKLKDFYKENPERLKEKEKKRRFRSIERIKEYRRRPEVKERRNERARSGDSRAWARAYEKRRRSIPFVRISKNLRSRLHSIVAGRKFFWKVGAEELVGCSRFKFIKYIESKWPSDGSMSWDNYGRKNGKRTWHIDHIVPIDHFREELNSFDKAKVRRTSLLLNHYTNLFPMWGPENQSKGAKKPEWVLIMGKKMTSDLHAKYLNLDLSDSPDEPDPEDS